jgi:hypothetical protein
METETWKHGYMDMETWKHVEIETSTENGSPVFLNPFTVCLSYKWKFVLCPFVDEETYGSYPFANGLKGHAHLWR